MNEDPSQSEPADNGANWAIFAANSVYQPRDSRPFIGEAGGNGH